MIDMMELMNIMDIIDLTGRDGYVWVDVITDMYVSAIHYIKRTTIG